jgi:hypothetical protein
MGIVGLLLALGACNFPGRQSATPTQTPNVTQAYQTVQARLTQAIAQTPQQTPTPVETESGLPTPSPSATPRPSATPVQATLSPTPPCDRAAADNPIDVTIPDDTVIKPGESFTKEWSLINVGSCPWTIDYAAVWFSGEMLGAPATVPLTDRVAVGDSIVISVDMTAPEQPGTYQSNWKLRNDSGLLFGIGPSGDSPFWVRIRVVDAGTATQQASPEPTLEVTPTPTPDVQASGTVDLAIGQFLDLDTLTLNPTSGTDLAYETSPEGINLLIPQNGTTLGVFGVSQPSLLACQNSNMSGGALPVDSLAIGNTYLCYRTDQGLFGWIRLVSREPVDFTLSLEILTWAAAP